MLVLAQGRLLRSSRLAELRAEAGVGSRVRTPQSDRLCAVLDATGHTYRPTDEGLVVDLPPEEVGQLVAQQGIVLHGLAATADLERAFFRIVQEAESGQLPRQTESTGS